MIWFIFSLSSLLLIGLITRTSKPRPKLYYQLALTTVIALFMAYVSPSGTDHETYCDIYDRTTTFDTDISFMALMAQYAIEPGYLLLNYLGNLAHLSHFGFFFVVAFITNFFYVKSFERFKSPLLLFLAFVLSESFMQQSNIVRQSIAVAIFVYSIRFIVEKKHWHYVVSVLIGISLHISAILMLPLVFLCFVNLEKYFEPVKKWLLIAWIVSLAVATGVISLGPLYGVLSIFGDSRYASYAEGRNDMGVVQAFNIFNTLLVAVTCLYNNRKDSIYYFLFLLGCIFQNLSYSFGPLMRIAQYFIVFAPLYTFTLLTPSCYPSKVSIYIKHLRILIILYFAYKLVFSNILGTSYLGTETFSTVSIFD